MIEIFNDTHAQQAAEIANRCYQEERKVFPVLPDVDFTGQFTGNYQRMAQNDLGIALTEGGRLLGFMLCYPPRESYYTGQKGVYCPLHGHGTAAGNRTKTYEKLYQAAAERWLAEGVLSHSITLYAEDKELVQVFFENGFGLNCVDAIRETHPIEADCKVDCDVRIIPAEDAEKLLPLVKGLHTHLTHSPIFLPKSPNPTLEGITDQIKRNEIYYLAAYQGGQVISYIKVGSAGENFASNAPGTANLCGAYTLPEYRGNGVTTLLLSKLMDKLQSEGIARCGVDCESYNPNAWHFWRKYFRPYTFSLVRSLNPKIL